MWEAILMKLCERDITGESAVIAVISTWEAVALLGGGRVPTVTSRVLLLPRPVRALLVAGVTWWMVGHFDVR
jgi:hypothetical protein